MDYGNVLYPITELLTTRYDRHLFTILTTNLTPSEIRPRYGDRIADRLNDMMGKSHLRQLHLQDAVAEKSAVCSYAPQSKRK